MLNEINNPLVSVIIPTRNSEKFIEACLLSVKKQSYKNIEIVVIDNYSIDRTREIAKKFTDKIYVMGPERSTQRNYGVGKSDGEYVLIMDSDMELSEKVVEKCVTKISSDESIKALVIPEESFGNGFWAKCKKLERSYYIGIEWMEAARFFRKNIFFEVGGYDEEMVSGEDWDLSQKTEKIGNLSRINEFIFHNEGEINLFKAIKKKYYYAQLFSKYRIMNQGNKKFKKQMSIFGRYLLFFSQPAKLLKQPAIGFGMLFMKLCEFVFGSFGYLFRKKRPDFSGKATFLLPANLPKVSFIIPTLNASFYLGRCLSSINNQNYPKEQIEVLVVDGGSFDDTVKIAIKHGAGILHNPKIIAEFGKSIGIKASTGDYFVLLDADNEIIEVEWLTVMVRTILMEPTLFGVESRLSFDPTLNSMNRYFARLRIADPLARMLATKPVVERKIGYDILRFPHEAILITGANGFLWNKALIAGIAGWQDVFEEANFGTYVHEVTGANYAVPHEAHVRHYYCQDIIGYLEKRKKIAQKIKKRLKSGNYVWVSKTSFLKIFFCSLYSFSIIGPGIEALYRSIKDRTFDWLWHPIVSSLTIYVYFINFIKKSKHEID